MPKITNKTCTLLVEGQKIQAKRTMTGNWTFRHNNRQYLIDLDTQEVFELQERPKPKMWFPVGRLEDQTVSFRPGARAVVR